MSEDGSSSVGEEMMSRRGYSYPGLSELWSADPEWVERYDRLAEYNLRRDEALSRKTRELIIINYAAIKGQVDALRNHIEEAYEYGATDEEILETIQLASHLGGAWTIVTAAEALGQLGIDLGPEE